jgi:hypothetical protein
METQNMKRAVLVAVTSVVVALWATAAAAHHSAQQFDFGRSVAITGVVKRFQSINPHMRLVIAVTDAKGTRDIVFEGHSTNNMYRAGYRDGMIKVGDKITVFVAVAGAIHVVRAVALERDLPRPLRVGDRQHQPHVRIDRLEPLDDPAHRGGLREFELLRGVMSGDTSAAQGQQCRNSY